MEAGEILVRRGLLDDHQLSQSRVQNQDGGSLVDAAVGLGFVSEEAALRALGDEVGLDYIDLADATVIGNGIEDGIGYGPTLNASVTARTRSRP